jgi:hypothetical protein
LRVSDEPLGLGIAVRIADPAHAGGDAVWVEHAGGLGIGVLRATVGMVDQAGAEMIGHRPADDARG